MAGGSRLALASEYHGQVTFGGLPVPGATITATQGDQKSWPSPIARKLLFC